MNKAIGFLFLGAVLAMVSPVKALDDSVNYTFNGTHVYDKGGVIDVKGALKIDGTQVTATAAQLNAAGNGVVTNGTIDTFVVTNLTAVTAITVPTASLAATALSGNIVQARMTNALWTAGPTIGGHIPVAAITNALAGTAYTTNVLTGDGKTNTFIFATVGTVKVLKSLTTVP